MGAMRRFRSWTRFGEAGTAGLDLPARRARALALEHGWRVVAGERLAERVRADAVRQGVLELVTAEKAWRDAVLPALPALASRLATLHPQLGVREVRLRLEGESELPSPLCVPASTASDSVSPPPSRPAPRERPAGSDEAAGPRLARLAARYLERSGRREG
jgi:hypothetical protein